MKNKERAVAWIRAGVASLALLALVAVPLLASSDPLAFLNESDSESAAAVSDDFQPKLQFVLNQVAKQNDVNRELKAELDSGSYSLDAPLIVTDPYGISPLTAVAVFTTDQPMRISVHVPGADALTDVDFSFDAYETDHVVPIYGLYADTVNPVTLTATARDGSSATATLEIETDPLSDELSDIIFLTDLAKPDQYQPGLNFSYEHKAAFDAHGAFRWYLLGDFNVTSNYQCTNGHMIVTIGATSVKKPTLLLEINPLGEIYKILCSPYGNHHDIEIMDENNLLVAGSNEETNQDMLFQLDVTTGKVVRALDLRTVFPRSRVGMFGPDTSDWLHLNDIVWLNDGSDMLLSARHQSFVARVKWPEGTIRWILGDPSHWPDMYQKYLLTPVGDVFEWQYSQHAPYVLPDLDHNPDTMDLLVFDNGNQRFDFYDFRAVAAESYTRIVHYRIDEKAMSVEQIWQYGKEFGHDLYASSRGNVVPAANDNLIASYCLETGGISHAEYREIDPNAQLVWQVLCYSKENTGDFVEYRVTRMPIYNSSANELLLDAKAVNLIPTEVLRAYGIH